MVHTFYKYTQRRISPVPVRVCMVSDVLQDNLCEHCEVRHCILRFLGDNRAVYVLYAKIPADNGVQSDKYGGVPAVSAAWLGQLGNDNPRRHSNAVRILHLRNGRYRENGFRYNIPAALYSMLHRLLPCDERVQGDYHRYPYRKGRIPLGSVQILRS